METLICLHGLWRIQHAVKSLEEHTGSGPRSPLSQVCKPSRSDKGRGHYLVRRMQCDPPSSLFQYRNARIMVSRRLRTSCLLEVYEGRQGHLDCRHAFLSRLQRRATRISILGREDRSVHGGHRSIRRAAVYPLRHAAENGPG